jgi:uncharacterized protein YqjF (DUF2071 family)
LPATPEETIVKLEPPPFLTGEWRWLATLNYEIAASALAPLVPSGTELDAWGARPFVSLVGFLFRKTRVLGLPVPFHQEFEEVNLRFYVRRKGGDGWRHGLVFVRELVPRRTVAAAARAFYNEKYWSVPMSHRIRAEQGRPFAASYFWKFQRQDFSVEARTGDSPARVEVREQDFFADVHWGYVIGRKGETLEYRVDHPRWTSWKAVSAVLEGNVCALYGEAFAEAFSAPPVSAFLSDGSAIAVSWRRPLGA